MSGKNDPQLIAIIDVEKKPDPKDGLTKYFIYHANMVGLYGIRDADWDSFVKKVSDAALAKKPKRDVLFRMVEGAEEQRPHLRIPAREPAPS